MKRWAFVLFLGCAIAGFAFQRSPLGPLLENRLFDLRTRLKPQSSDAPEVVLVTLDEDDLSELGSPRVESYVGFFALAQRAMQFSQRAVMLILPHHDVDYDSSSFADFFAELSKERGLYLGTFDLAGRFPGERRIPTPLCAQVDRDDRAASVSSLRPFRREVVRRLPLLSFQGRFLAPQLPLRVARDVLDDRGQARLDALVAHAQHRFQRARGTQAAWTEVDLPSVTLNYEPYGYFPVLSARDLLAGKGWATLKGKVVMIGYTAFRKRNYRYRDGTYANTPWSGGSMPEVLGTPYLHVVATQMQGLLRGNTLTRAPFYYEGALLAVSSLAAMLVWLAPPFVAVLGFLGVIALSCYTGALFMSYAHLNIDASATIVATILCGMGGAFLRGRRDVRELLRREHRARSKRELAQMQGRFLDRFSGQLHELNHALLGKLAVLSERKTNDARMTLVHSKAVETAEGLGRYLASIRQLAKLSSEQTRAFKRTQTDVDAAIARARAQLAHIETAREIDVVDQGRCHFHAYSSSAVVESILFNLLSNAYKYSPQKSTVTIERRVSTRRITIAVTDEGPGIPRHLQERIFAKFYRVKNDQTYQVEGSGLGLYLCRFFARRVGATVTLAEAKTGGSVFSLELPRSPRGSGNHA